MINLLNSITPLYNPRTSLSFIFLSSHSHLPSSSACWRLSKVVNWSQLLQNTTSLFPTAEGCQQTQPPLEPETWRTRKTLDVIIRASLICSANTERSDDPPDPADQLHCVWVEELLQIRELCQDTRAVLQHRQEHRGKIYMCLSSFIYVKSFNW